jgi:hypothetical protein
VITKKLKMRVTAAAICPAGASKAMDGLRRAAMDGAFASLAGQIAAAGTTWERTDFEWGKAQ